MRCWARSGGQTPSSLTPRKRTSISRRRRTLSCVSSLAERSHKVSGNLTRFNFNKTVEGTWSPEGTWSKDWLAYPESTILIYGSHVLVHVISVDKHNKTSSIYRVGVYIIRSCHLSSSFRMGMYCYPNHIRFKLLCVLYIVWIQFEEHSSCNQLI